MTSSQSSKSLVICHDRIVGSSIWNIARDLTPVFEKEGYTVQTVRVGADWEGTPDLFLNLVPSHLPKLLDQKRFRGIGKIVSVLTCHLDEFPILKPVQWLAPHCLLDIPLIVPSEHSYVCARRYAKSWYCPSKSLKFISNLKLSSYGIAPGFSPGANDKNKFVVPANGWAYGKRLDLLHDITVYIKTLHPETTHTFWHAEKRRQEQEKAPEFNWVVQPPTLEEYQQNIRDCGLFVATARAESFGLMYLELLLSGVVGVFPNRPWVHSLIPGYKYVADTDPGLTRMALAVYDSYEECHQYLLSEVIPSIRARYSQERFVKDVISCSY